MILYGILVGLYWTIMRPLQKFVATLQYFQREADHDSVYAALKVSTDYAVQQFASDLPDFLGEYKQREKEALEIPCLFEGTEELLHRLTAVGARNFWFLTVTIT